jgi:hypothetical protein
VPAAWTRGTTGWKTQDAHLGVEIAVLPHANHLFQDAQSGGPSEYAPLPAEFTPDLVPTIANWLQDHRRSRPDAGHRPIYPNLSHVRKHGAGWEWQPIQPAP